MALDTVDIAGETPEQAQPFKELGLVFYINFKTM